MARRTDAKDGGKARAAGVAVDAELVLVFPDASGGTGGTGGTGGRHKGAGHASGSGDRQRPDRNRRVVSVVRIQVVSIGSGLSLTSENTEKHSVKLPKDVSLRASMDWTSSPLIVICFSSTATTPSCVVGRGEGSVQASQYASCAIKPPMDGNLSQNTGRIRVGFPHVAQLLP